MPDGGNIAIDVKNTFGYARISTKEQNLNRQLDALENYGVEKSMIYQDKASGKDFERPEYRRLMRRLRPGSTLVVKSIDRLGRSYDEILEEWRRITKEKKADIVVLDMPLLNTRQTVNGITGVFLSELVLQILSYVAQVERELIHQRQEEGIASAKARGVRFGRPRIPVPDSLGEVLQCFGEGEITRSEAARRLGVCPRTFDAWRKAAGEEPAE